MKKILFIFCLLNGFFTLGYADPNDCIQDGGDTLCTYPAPTAWGYNLCDEAGSFPIRWLSWCPVRGGTWITTNSGFDCIGTTPDNEANLKERSSRFSYLVHGITGSTSDTGWGQTISSNLCFSGSPSYKNDVLVRDFRRFYFSKPEGVFETISALRGRDLECPKGTYSKYDKQKNYVCVNPFPSPKGCTADAKGNPCSITTGNKFQPENDWFSSNGLLSIKRVFNSLNSSEATAFPIGKGWTHNYNKKITFWKYLDGDTPSDITNSDSLYGFFWGTLTKEDGKEIYIYKNFTDTTVSGQSGWFISRDESLIISKQEDNLWRVDDLKNGVKEYYDQNGIFIKKIYQNGQFILLSYQNSLLDKVTDNFGRSLKFSYNTQGLISSITLPNNQKITYQYDSQYRLINSTRPSYGTKTYHYSENSTVAPSGNPNVLTGITDEIGKRYANYAYDAQDRGILTEHAGGSQKYTLQHYDSYTNVIDPYGATWRYNKTIASGTPRISSSSRANITQSQDSYDQAGNITKKTEKGLTTTYTYNLSRNLETSRTEAVGTAKERTIQTIWHTDFAKPVEIKTISAGRTLQTITYSYDANGNLLTKKVTDPNTQASITSIYEYNRFGQITKYSPDSTANFTYEYDATNGNLIKSTDSSGVSTTYGNFNASGLPGSIKTNTGMTINYEYDAADRVIKQIEKVAITQLSTKESNNGLSWWQYLINTIYKTFGAVTPYQTIEKTYETQAQVLNAQDAVTQYIYDPRGLLTTTILPDGEHVVYRYDDAHRLIEIQDQNGNRTVYTLNSNGDITQTDVYGTSGQLESKIQQVYDNFGRLQKSIGNNQQIQTFNYNNYDQLTNQSNSLNQSYKYTYDTLGRQNAEIDPSNNTSQNEYDPFDQLSKVIDANGSATSYQYNGIGQLIKQNSPDAGVVNYSYYTNGRLANKINPLNKITYAYNPNGAVRLKYIFSGNTEVERENYSYGSIGVGTKNDKLLTSNNKYVNINFNYDPSGLVRNKTTQYLKTNTSSTPPLNVYYSYTVGGKVKQLGLPSGNIVNYDYNANGQMTGIRLNEQSFIGDIQYNANGISSWKYSGLGDTVKFDYDLDGRVKRVFAAYIFDRNYSFDAADRILAINDPNQTLVNSNFVHDALSRLTEQKTSNKSFNYTYDKNSNRLTRKITQSNVAKTENYTIATPSNQIGSIQKDSEKRTFEYLATGQITNDGIRNYSYDAQGRSETISGYGSSIQNAYDPFGQRIQKFSGNGTQTLFVYDESGQLLGEYTPEGKVIREYIWLADRLVGLRSYQYPDQILRVYTDHLGTVRAISNSSNQVLWRFEGDQFGDELPYSDNLVMPLRHPGQYYDAEVKVFYNYFRDYDPATGRYVQSDPIGLAGGLNTYGYVGGNPLHAIDPKGLWMAIPAGAGEALGAAAAVGLISTFPKPENIPIQGTKREEKKCDKDCPPCTPYPVGTIGYQGPKTSVRGMHGTRTGGGEEHYILFEVQQNPQTCQCRWQENKKVAGHHYMWLPNIFMTINLNGKGRPPSYP